MTAKKNYCECLWKIYNFNLTSQKASHICFDPNIAFFVTFFVGDLNEAVKIKEMYTSLLLKSHSDLLKRGMFSMLTGRKKSFKYVCMSMPQWWCGMWGRKKSGGINIIFHVLPLVHFTLLIDKNMWMSKLSR